MSKQPKNTPSDNKQGRSQNSNMQGGDNPQTSGGSFEEVKDEAFRDRESGRNESGNENKPRRGTGEHGAGQKDNQKAEQNRGQGSR